MSAQQFHPTATKRGELSTPMARILRHGLLVGRALDFGCGRGEDADITGIEKYDPVSFPTKPEGKFNTIMCTYVLNVIWLPWERAQVLKDIRDLLAPGGRAYITVRRGIKRGLKRWRRTRWGYQVEVVLDEERFCKTGWYETYVIKEEET